MVQQPLRLFIVLIAVLIAMIAAPCHMAAQASLYYEEWRWAHFTTESGLPSNRIYSVFETRDSTFWTVTAGGIAWYDGFRWHSVSPKGPLPTEPTSKLCEADSGSLIAYIAGDAYRITKMSYGPLLRNCQAVPMGGTKLLVDHIGKYGREISCFDSGRFTPANLTFDPNFFIPNYPKMWATRHSVAWLLGTQYVHRYQNGVWTDFLHYPPGPLTINDIAENGSGEGVASLSQPLSLRGLWEWHKGAPPRYNKLQRGDWIRSMDINEAGTVIAVDLSGQVLERRNGTWATVFPLPAQMRSANSVRYTQSGKLLIGGENGLYVFDPGINRWTSSLLPAPNKGRVHEIVLAHDGTIWLGTADGLEIHRTDGSIQLVSSILGQNIVDVTGVAEDSKGHIWISSGVAFDGAYEWDGKTWKHLEIDKSYSPLRVHKIRKNRKGDLMFLCMGKTYGGIDQPGAFQYDGNSFVHFGTKEGMRDNRVYAFAEGPDSAYWFGTRRSLSKWKDGKWTQWDMDKNIPGAKIFALAVDSSRNVWFTDHYNTVGWLAPSGKLTYLSEADGLLNRVVSDFYVDSTGKVWISTERGIAAYDHGTWLKFDAASGLECPNIWPVVAHEGKIYAGTLGSGLTILNLSRCNMAQVSVSIDDPVIEEGKIYIQWRPTAYEGIPTPADIYTRYRTGNGNWSEWSHDHSVTMTDLRSGEYRFDVEARNLFQSGSQLIHTRKFAIQPPLYLRLPFVLPLSVITLALVVLIVSSVNRERRFTRELQNRETKLSALALRISQAQEAERRSVATYLHDEISQALGYCKMKLALLTEHAANDEVTSVHDIISELYEKARFKTFDLSPHVLYELGLAEALRVLGEKIEEQHRFAVIFEERNTNILLEDDRSVIVFRAVQELLVNVAKHAGASVARVTLAGNAAKLVVVVEDDGRGINSESERAKRNGSGGFGLFNLRERVGSIGGSLSLRNTGAGTEAVLTVPQDPDMNIQREI